MMLERQGARAPGNSRSGASTGQPTTSAIAIEMSGADDEAGDVRIAQLDRQIGAGIGADAVERRLREIDDAAVAEQEADADAGNGVDAR